MDTAYFEELLAKYVHAVNSEDEEIEEAGWAVIVEAANLLGVAMPTGDASIR